MKYINALIGCGLIIFGLATWIVNEDFESAAILLLLANANLTAYYGAK